MSDLDSGPGLSFPPPVVYCITFVIAQALERFAPLTGDLPYFWVRVGVGSVLLAIGIGLCWWAMGFFRQHETPLMPNARANDLVRVGPYRFSRNPMYVALFFQYAGVSLAVGSVWALLLMPAMFAFIRYVIVHREEKYLASEFGDSYLEYTAEVRRWI